jgi:hypothetical protein
MYSDKPKNEALSNIMIKIRDLKHLVEADLLYIRSINDKEKLDLILCMNEVMDTLIFVLEKE